MGEMADLYDEYYDDFDENQPSAKDYFNEGPEWLVEHTSHSRKPIVMGIRNYWLERQIMSEKQQWVLAFWLFENDNEHS